MVLSLPIDYEHPHYSIHMGPLVSDTMKSSGCTPFPRNMALQPSILKMEAVCSPTTYIIDYTITKLKSGYLKT
jgi:hypothetical protein